MTSSWRRQRKKLRGSCQPARGPALTLEQTRRHARVPDQGNTVAPNDNKNNGGSSGAESPRSEGARSDSDSGGS
eukprot:11167424-Lingulodinium_polyedra.AAC.1